MTLNDNRLPFACTICDLDSTAMECVRCDASDANADYNMFGLCIRSLI